MSVDLQRVETADEDQFLQYRALSTPAVASLVLGVLSLSAVLAWISWPFRSPAWCWELLPADGFQIGPTS